jgi:molecular chaperone GrpE
MSTFLDQERSGFAAGPEDPSPAAGGLDAEAAASEATGTAAGDGELRQRYIRLMADLENVRKRQAATVAQEVARAKASAFADLLPALDSLGRAQRAQDATLEQLREGLRAIEAQLLSALQRQGVERIEATSGPLDPHSHEALAAVPSTDRPAGHIVECVRPGYRVGGLLLRPAQVVVAAAPPQEGNV